MFMEEIKRECVEGTMKKCGKIAIISSVTDASVEAKEKGWKNNKFLGANANSVCRMKGKDRGERLGEGKRRGKNGACVNETNCWYVS